MVNLNKSFVTIPKRDVVLQTHYGIFLNGKFVDFFDSKLDAYSKMNEIMFQDNNFHLSDFILCKVQSIKI